MKVSTKNRWFATRPSGTEDICKIYAENFKETDHLDRSLEEAPMIVGDALTASPSESGIASTSKIKEKP
nr:hypothetical protein [Desulfobacter hydrogenophilus]